MTGGFDAAASLKDMTNEELADMSTIPGWNLVHNPPRHNPRGALVGKVVSDKMQKTVNVAVDRYKIVPKYDCFAVAREFKQEGILIWMCGRRSSGCLPVTLNF